MPEMRRMGRLAGLTLNSFHSIGLRLGSQYMPLTIWISWRFRASGAAWSSSPAAHRSAASTPGARGLGSQVLQRPVRDQTRQPRKGPSVGGVAQRLHDALVDYLVRVRVGLHGHNEPPATRQKAPVAQPVEFGANPLRTGSPHRVRARSAAPSGVRLELHNWGRGTRRLLGGPVDRSPEDHVEHDAVVIGVHVVAVGIPVACGPVQLHVARHTPPSMVDENGAAEVGPRLGALHSRMQHPVAIAVGGLQVIAQQMRVAPQPGECALADGRGARIGGGHSVRGSWLRSMFGENHGLGHNSTILAQVCECHSLVDEHDGPGPSNAVALTFRLTG